MRSSGFPLPRRHADAGPCCSPSPSSATSQIELLIVRLPCGHRPPGKGLRSSAAAARSPSAPSGLCGHALCPSRRRRVACPSVSLSPCCPLGAPRADRTSRRGSRSSSSRWRLVRGQTWVFSDFFSADGVINWLVKRLFVKRAFFTNPPSTTLVTTTSVAEKMGGRGSGPRADVRRLPRPQDRMLPIMLCGARAV